MQGIQSAYGNVKSFSGTSSAAWGNIMRLKVLTSIATTVATGTLSGGTITLLGSPTDTGTAGIPSTPTAVGCYLDCDNILWTP